MKAWNISIFLPCNPIILRFPAKLRNLLSLVFTKDENNIGQNMILISTKAYFAEHWAFADSERARISLIPAKDYMYCVQGNTELLKPLEGLDKIFSP